MLSLYCCQQFCMLIEGPAGAWITRVDEAFEGWSNLAGGVVACGKAVLHYRTVHGRAQPLFCNLLWHVKSIQWCLYVWEPFRIFLYFCINEIQTSADVLTIDSENLVKQRWQILYLVINLLREMIQYYVSVSGKSVPFLSRIPFLSLAFS